MADATKEELKKAADKEAERIMASDEGKNTDNNGAAGGETLAGNTQMEIDGALDRASRSDDARTQRGATAMKKLRTIAQSYPLSTPDEHTVFGFGGHKFTLGELRDVTAVR